MAKEIIVEVPEGYSEEDLNEAMEELQKSRARKVKYAEKRADQMKDPNYIANYKEKSRRYLMRSRLLLRKAVAAGIEVSDKEIDEAIAAQAE